MHRPSSSGPGGAGPGTPPTGGDHHAHHLKAPRWTTPNLLRAGGALIGVLALAAAVATSSLASEAHTRIDAITHTEAPSVKAAGDFLLRVEDMDAQLGNALLISADITLRTTRPQSMKIYEDERLKADADLQAATAALAGNPDALNRLNQVVDMFGSYQQLATRALQLDEQSNTTKAGTAPANVVAAYRDALVYLAGTDGSGSERDTLIAHAQQLYDTSNADIKAAADKTQATLNIAGTALFGLSLFLLAGLGIVQWRMSVAFRRTLNPGLAAASTAAIVMLIAGMAAFHGTSDDFRNGKSNAFDSVQSLTRAKAVSYDANADETRWLLDPTHADQYEKAFLAKSRQIARLDTAADGEDLATFEADIARADASLAEHAGPADQDLGQANPLSTGSLLGFELANITFSGEYHAARIAVDDYSTYLQGDAKIRQFPIGTPAGLHDAVDFDTNAETPGTSDQTFNMYSQHLDDVITVNQSEFDWSMAAALSRVGSWSWLPYVFLVAIAGLTLLGLRPRLADYR